MIYAMPKLGEIRKGTETGHKTDTKLIWAICMDCGKERWVPYIVKTGQHLSKRCWHCNGIHTMKTLVRGKGDKNARWKGGRRHDGYGYIQIWLPPDDFFYPMVHGRGYVLEHRLIVAKSLGRCLQSWEIVHHKNGIKDDNRLENLQLVMEGQHKQITIMERKIHKSEIRIKQLEARVTLLEAENVTLRSESSLLNKSGVYPKD